MQLPHLYEQKSVLADGSTIYVPIYRVMVLWNGVKRAVRVLATRRRPLLGTALLDDQKLRVRSREGDLVSIDAL